MCLEEAEWYNSPHYEDLNEDVPAAKQGQLIVVRTPSGSAHAMLIARTSALTVGFVLFLVLAYRRMWFRRSGL